MSKPFFGSPITNPKPGPSPAHASGAGADSKAEAAKPKKGKGPKAPKGDGPEVAAAPAPASNGTPADAKPRARAGAVPDADEETCELKLMNCPTWISDKDIYTLYESLGPMTGPDKCITRIKWRMRYGTFLRVGYVRCVDRDAPLSPHPPLPAWERGGGFLIFSPRKASMALSPESCWF